LNINVSPSTNLPLSFRTFETRFRTSGRPIETLKTRTPIFEWITAGFGIRSSRSFETERRFLMRWTDIVSGPYVSGRNLKLPRTPNSRRIVSAIRFRDAATAAGEENNLREQLEDMNVVLHETYEHLNRANNEITRPQGIIDWLHHDDSDLARSDSCPPALLDLLLGSPAPATAIPRPVLEARLQTPRPALDVVHRVEGAHRPQLFHRGV
jgi:hypothetical protein